MWFITLLVLAVAAVLIVKAVKAHSERQSSSAADQEPTSGLHGSLRRTENADQTRQSPPAADDIPENVSTTTATNTASSEQVIDQPDSSTTLNDIREMIKTLNLTDSDSARLGISSEEFNALRNRENADTSTLPLPDATTQADIAERLRRMLN
ncbi:hypothetical protein ACUNV4_06710 [Granulosicoccus sp. 3-233]|uniref:hypothetical protein n=1 Tax=Granulosicoccus sp. 3-233 TaxID=3417969 RepID=UPI003D33C876